LEWQRVLRIVPARQECRELRRALIKKPETWIGSLGIDSVRFGSHGEAEHGEAEHGEARQSWIVTAMFGAVRSGSHGEACLGEA